jgi:ribose/xylose/arabinose/galactoside ABC-type transport system permease subunit
MTDRPGRGEQEPGMRGEHVSGEHTAGEAGSGEHVTDEQVPAAQRTSDPQTSGQGGWPRMLQRIWQGMTLRIASMAWTVLAPFVGLVVVLIIFSIYQPEGDPSPFLTVIRAKLIAKQSAIVGIGALGMTVIIISGGIDLSAGSMLALTSVVLAVGLRNGVSPVWGVALVLIAGAAIGALNGLLITGLRLVPFIVTLGTMMLYRGMALWLSGQTKIQAEAPDWISKLLNPPPRDSLQLLCTGDWVVVALALVLAAVLRYSIFGRYVFAVGSNETTARLCGINVPKTKIIVYAIGGLFMGLAGIFSFANLSNQADPKDGVGLELDLIAAVVIGGGSLSGGRGSVLGSIIGALTMTTLRSGCDYAEVSEAVQYMIIGGIIIAAVAVDQRVHQSGDG